MNEKIQSSEKTFVPFELNENATFNRPNPSTGPTEVGDSPSNDTPREEILGQNQVANIVADKMQDEIAWSSATSEWFRRSNKNKPFREYETTHAWLKISDQIAQIRPKFTAGFVNGVEVFAKALLAVPEWNNTKSVLPVTNGVYDLKTRQLRAYRVDDRFNWQLPYQYDPHATCPLIDATLSRMVGYEKALESFLQSWMLVVLLGRYDVQAFLELVGDGGTGKSTFLRLLTFLVGEENTNSTDLNSLESNKFETAALYGKRLTIVTDSARYRGEVPVLKSITGGDFVRLERKHQQQRKPFIYEGLVAIAANQPLESSDYSSGLQRRRRPLTINYVVSDDEKRPYRNKDKYPDGFEGELRKEMPGLLNRLLAIDVNEAVNLVSDPDHAMQLQRLTIELETNPLLAWANEYLVRCRESENCIGLKDNDPNDGLFSSYCYFTEQRGQSPVSLVRFSRALADILRAYGVDTEKDRGKFTFMKGLRLRRNSDRDEWLLSNTAKG